MPLYSLLFPIRTGSGAEIRSPEGGAFGFLEDIEVQSFFEGRI